jgi:hypothetical protein
MFCSSISPMMKSLLLDELQMQEGHLHVWYLGVLLISSKLSSADCMLLLEKITKRINSRTSKYLSLTGRLQLLSSILYSIQVFWYGIFILPKKIIKAIEQKFNRFFWNGNDIGIVKAKVV